MGLRTDLATRLIKRSFDQRFKMARLTRLPVVGRMMDYALFRGDDIIILPKEDVFRTIELNIPVDRTNVVLPSQVIEHFIDRSRYIFLMDKCMCRDANKCRDYPATTGCIFLGKGVKRIPAGMGRLVDKDEAKVHLAKAREAGLVHLIGRDRIDSVWLNIGPSEDLMSICSCCPCCCLWKMTPDLAPNIGATLSRMPGVEISIIEKKCIGCGQCVRDKVCYVRAISMKDGKAHIDDVLCKGCARCVESCRQGAFELSITDPSFMEATIQRISPLVDIDSE